MTVSSKKTNEIHNNTPVSFEDKLYLEMLLRKPSPVVAVALARLATPQVKADFLGVEVEEEARRRKTYIKVPSKTDRIPTWETQGRLFCTSLSIISTTRAGCK